jgi:hypothetical protein
VPVVFGIDPKLRLDSRSSGGIIVLQRQGGVVGINVSGIEHLTHHPLVQILEERRALHQPLGHQGVDFSSFRPIRQQFMSNF